MKTYCKLKKNIRLKSKNNEIIIDQIINTETEKWTYDELDDLIYAFTKTFNYFVNSDCVSGVIEITNKRCLDDDYLDSD